MGTIKDFKYKLIKNFLTKEEIKLLTDYCRIIHRINFNSFDFEQSDNGDTRFYISIKTSTNSLSVGFNNGFDSGVALIKLGANDFNQQFTNIIIVYKGPTEPLSLALNGTQQDLFLMAQHQVQTH